MQSVCVGGWWVWVGVVGGCKESKIFATMVENNNFPNNFVESADILLII